MKKAIGYIRISTEDQSNFSLDGQERYIREYAEKNDIEILSMFKDDGKSAKNFDRPDWIKLEEFIKVHHRSVNYLIVINYTRFSRNAAEGLMKIEMLEKRFQIIIVSVFEQMFIDYDSPYFFKQRADMLVNAEFELHVIRDRTKFGINQGLTSGRYMGPAPYGYKNARDQFKKPVLVKDELKAEIVEQIYMNFLAGIPNKDNYQKVAALGYSAKGHSAIAKVLANCVYGGLVHVPTYRKEQARYVKGIHEQVVSEATWWEVQYQLGNVTRPRKVLNDEAPLRGVLLCDCSKPLTAAKSRGKRNYYWYYKCNAHAGSNFSARKVHEQFDEVLKHLSLSEIHIEYLREEAKAEIDTLIKEKSNRLPEAERNLKSAAERLEQLEERFITGKITADVYNKWYSRYSHEHAELKKLVDSFQDNSNAYWKLFNDQIDKLGDIHHLYHLCDLHQKHTFIRQVFDCSLKYHRGVYRTPYLISLFEHNTLILKEKGLLLVEQPSKKSGEKFVSTA
jgi:site-specific DNA recombinase